jgi:hypothetical protein
MRTLTSSRSTIITTAAILAIALLMASTATVDAGRPRKPPPTSPPSVSIQIAPTGTLEPSREYANVDVTITCPQGATFSFGRLYVLQGDLGGAGTFNAACTGSAQVATARVVNGMRFTLADWTATAYVGISQNGKVVQTSATRTIRLVPGITARVADQGQLTGTAGGGVAIAVAVACPTGATGQASSVTVSQGAAQGTAIFTPICNSTTRMLVLPIAASQGTFHTGSALADASVTVTSLGESFSGVDNRAVTILESSTGDVTPPTAPGNLRASTFGSGDGETRLRWNASTDNATPSGLITYEVFLNGNFDQAIGAGFLTATLYVELDVLNTVEVVAVDGAGNRSAPASVTVVGN